MRKKRHISESDKRLACKHAKTASRILLSYVALLGEDDDISKSLTEIVSKYESGLNSIGLEADPFRQARKMDFIGKMISYCESLPPDFSEAKYDIKFFANEFKFDSVSVAAKSTLGEAWVTQTGETFCFVPLCDFNPTEEENARMMYHMYEGKIPKRETKEGLDSSSMGLIYDDFDDREYVILKRIDSSCFTYRTWDNEIINFKKATHSAASAGYSKSCEFFKMLAAVGQISEAMNQKQTA